MSSTPFELYLALMKTIRGRLDLIQSIRTSKVDDFSRAETAAFHGRKVVEGISFACLVAIENGLKHVPRDAKGQWNAETILQSLKSKNIQTLPSPSFIRDATDSERKAEDVKIVIEGVPANRLTHDELITIYQGLHRWLHEVNPYVETNRESFHAKHAQSLWSDIERVDRFIDRHFISISGEGFFCTLRDKVDGFTKVASLSKPPPS